MLNKPAWMSDQTWRTLRTAAEVFAGVFAAALLAVLNGYAQTHALAWDTLWYQGVVLGVAAVVAWLLNRE